MSEIWKDIYFVENGVEWDYRGLYQVSNYGRVKSLNYLNTGKEKIIKPFDNGKGYKIVDLCKNSKKKFRVHRLVAFMFLTDSYFDGADVDHINTDRTNNHVSNLRWCTRKENCNNELTKKHCSETNKGEKNGRATLVDRFDKQGNYIDTKYNFEYVEMGFNRTCITDCCRGKQKSTGGYVFKYHNE